MDIINKIKVGDKIYCTLFGDVTVQELYPNSVLKTHIKIKDNEGVITYLNKEGKYTERGECVLFPSKENRDWSTYSPKFNINTLEPFDKVLVRDKDNHCWTTGLYSHYEDYGDMRFFISNNISWNQCVPYNDDTKHLVGTIKMPDDKYINW